MDVLVRGESPVGGEGGDPERGAHVEAGAVGQRYDLVGRRA